MLTFGFAMMISVCKNPEGKRRDFCRFTMTLKTVIFVHVQGGILQKALTLHFLGVPI